MNALITVGGNKVGRINSKDFLIRFSQPLTFAA